jgi:hypothetical protein
MFAAAIAKRVSEFKLMCGPLMSMRCLWRDLGLKFWDLDFEVVAPLREIFQDSRLRLRKKVVKLLD